MISIEEALQRVEQTKVVLDGTQIPVEQAGGMILSEDVHSPIAMPPFDQSAMDGYAICGEGNSFKLIGEIQAGGTFDKALQKGEACRIFTGAMTPKGTTSIAKQEIVKVDGDEIELKEDVKEGTSIRRKGEEIALNGMALPKGTRINAAAIGFLSGLGVTHISAYRKPKVGLIVSGNELMQPGSKLEAGKIYESNSKTLQALLSDLRIEADLYFVEDNYESTIKQIVKAFEDNDMVILTGGISVGDYDFVKAALEELEVEEVFYKVKQKPGKPIYYGKKGNKRVFALPGNPAAVMTCFHVYVRTAIGFMKGEEWPFLIKKKAKLTHDHFKKGGRAHFLKAAICEGQVSININQSSAMLSSFVNANCLVYMDDSEKQFKKGDEVEAFLIRN